MPDATSLDLNPSYTGLHRDLVRILPDGPRRVLDVGCATGAMGRYLADTQGSAVWGIEYDAAMAELARASLRGVFHADLNRVSVASLTHACDYDLVVCGDVLEHLVDPWALLARIRATLAPSGAVAACIPNMQHWSVTVRLVTGELHYEAAGLLDRTHLRWFTRATIDAMFRGAGYDVVRWGRRVYDAPMRDRALAAIGNMAAVVGADPDAARSDADVFQWLVLARAARSPEPRS